jgi:hypothetical protein
MAWVCITRFASQAPTFILAGHRIPKLKNGLGDH